MANISIAYCRQLAQARRAKGLTQSAVAEAVGCKQSALSMLEAGQASKLSQETVEKIAALLEVPLETAATAAPASPAAAPAAVNTRAYCPHADCFSNVPYVVNGELLFWPKPQADGRTGATHCAVCGKLLERRCPHCGAAVTTEGACCPTCGGARVLNTLPPETDCEAWAAQRRREIAEWRSLIL